MLAQPAQGPAVRMLVGQMLVRALRAKAHPPGDRAPPRGARPSGCLWVRCSYARSAPKPIHQVTAPPSVAPAVATSTAGQNNNGLSLTRPNTAGSEPSGSRVEETKA